MSVVGIGLEGESAQNLRESMRHVAPPADTLPRIGEGVERASRGGVRKPHEANGPYMDPRTESLHLATTNPRGLQVQAMTRSQFRSLDYSPGGGAQGGTRGGKEGALRAPETVGAPSSLGDWGTNETFASAIPINSKTKWLTMARKVLRFYGYFRESVPDGFNEPQQRLHKVTLLYYLENDTLQVVEEKDDTHGIRGGVWVKRGKVPNPEANPPRAFTAEDLCVGVEVVLHGHQVMLYDCDEFTRGFLPVDMPLALPCPDQPPATGPGSTSNVPIVVEQPLSPRNARAVNLKTPRSTADGLAEPEVLEYTGVWLGAVTEGMEDHGIGQDNRPSTRVKILVYPEDDTIELKQATGKARMGRQTFLHLLKRSRVPHRERMQTASSVSEIGLTTNAGADADSFLSVQDFVIGDTVSIVNRDIHIIACVPKTREWWYRRNVLMPPDMVQVERVVPSASSTAPVKVSGKKVDMSNPVVIAKAKEKTEKRRKFYQQAKHGAKTTQMVAKDITPVRQSVEREFSLKYFFEDQSFIVYVHSPINTGGPAGVFLRRTQHINPATKAPFAVEELVPGTVLRLPNAVMEIIPPSEAKILPIKSPRSTEEEPTGPNPPVVSFANSKDLGWSGAAAIAALEVIHKKFVSDEMTPTDLLRVGEASRSPNQRDEVSLEEFNRRLDAILGPALLPPASTKALFYHLQGVLSEDQPSAGFWPFFTELVFNKSAWKVMSGISRAWTMPPDLIDMYVAHLWIDEIQVSKRAAIEQLCQTILEYNAKTLRLGGFLALVRADAGIIASTNLVPLKTMTEILTGKLFMMEPQVQTLFSRMLPEGVSCIHCENMLTSIKRFAEFRQTGRFITETSKRESAPRAESVKGQPNGLLTSPPSPRYSVAVVEFLAPGGWQNNQDKDKFGSRFDSVPLANGMIRSGIGCELLRYDPSDHDAFARKCKSLDGVIVRIPPLEMSSPSMKPHRAKFDNLMQHLVSQGKVVWTTPEVYAHLSPKEVLSRLEGLSCGLQDTQAYHDRQELEEGFKQSAAVGPRVLKPHGGVNGEGVWACWLQGKAYQEQGGAPLTDDDQLKLMEMSDGHVEYHTVREFLDFMAQGTNSRIWRSRSHGAHLDAGKHLVDMRFLPQVREGEARVVMVKDTPFQVIHKVPVGPGGLSAVRGQADFTYHAPNTPPFSRIVQGFVKQDLPRLMKSVGLQRKSQLPLLWTMDFIPDDQAAYGYVLSDLNVTCVDVYWFADARGPDKTLADVPRESYQKGQKLCDLVGRMCMETLTELVPKAEQI